MISAELRWTVPCFQNLSDECREYTEQLMRAAAHDYRMDARLVAECGDEVGSSIESLYSLLRYILRAPSVAVVDEMELDPRQMLS